MHFVLHLMLFDYRVLIFDPNYKSTQWTTDFVFVCLLDGV